MDRTSQLIVVIEDDAGMRRALQRLLRASGFETLLFDSAETYAAKGVTPAPDCLVLDVQLPGASGPHFYEQLHCPRPPAVFITSYDNAVTRKLVATAGGTELLIKPFVAKDLFDAIARVTRGHSTI